MGKGRENEMTKKGKITGKSEKGNCKKDRLVEDKEEKEEGKKERKKERLKRRRVIVGCEKGK